MANNVRCAGRPMPPVGVGSAEVGLPDAAYQPCGWEGPADDARTGNTHTVGSTTVREYRCPVCGGRVEMIQRATG